MLQSMLLSAGGGGGLTAIGAISGAGLSSGLQVCVDAGDFQSWGNASLQTWADMSPNGNFFFRGSGSDATSADPTFNGPVGYLPSYWSMDGTQSFIYRGVVTNTAAFQAIHRDNASFSIAALVYVPSTGTISTANDYCGDIVTTGFRFGAKTSGRLTFLVANTGATVVEKTGDSSLAIGWHFVGVSVTEAVGSGFLYADGSYALVSGTGPFNATYASPAAGDANGVMKIAGPTAPQANSRISFLALWSRALAKTEFDALWALMRSRFGL